MRTNVSPPTNTDVGDEHVGMVGTSHPTKILVLIVMIDENILHTMQTQPPIGLVSHDTSPYPPHRSMHPPLSRQSDKVRCQC